METQTMTMGKTITINSIGACGCDSDVRAFLSNGTSICLDAYADKAIPQHRNCDGDLAHNGKEVFCTKCNKTLLSTTAFNKCSYCGLPHWECGCGGHCFDEKEAKARWDELANKGWTNCSKEELSELERLNKYLKVQNG